MITAFRRQRLLARLACGGYFAGAVLVPTLHLAFHDLIPHDHEGGGIHIHWQDHEDHADHDDDGDDDHDHDAEATPAAHGEHHHHHEPFDPHHGDGSLEHFSAALIADAPPPPAIRPLHALGIAPPLPSPTAPGLTLIRDLSVRGPPRWHPAKPA